MNGLKTVPFSILASEYEERKAAIDRTKKERDELMERLAVVDATLKSLEEPETAQLDSTGFAVPAILANDLPIAPKRIKQQKTLQEYIVAIMRQYRRPMKTDELEKLVRERGYQTISGKNSLISSISSLLSSNPNFRRTAPATFMHTPSATIVGNAMALSKP